MKALILDFDQTIADTSMLEAYRQTRRWQIVYARMHEIQVYDGIYELLDLARTKAYKLGIVTNSPSKYCKIALAQLKIEVDALVGYHDVVRRKPFPDPVQKAVRQLGSDPSRTFGLGDAIDDIRAYISAMIRPVYCTWGAQSGSLTRLAEDVIVIHKPNEMGELL